MISRRLLSSLAGSCVVAAVMGCNALVGNEDVVYTETSSKSSVDAGKDTSVGPGTPLAPESDASFIVDASDDAVTVTDAAADD